MSRLLPCPFCRGEAELMLEGTQPDITCLDCGISYGIQASDHFTREERFNDAGFAFIMEPHYCYAEKGKQRAREVLTEYWNNRAPYPQQDVQGLIDALKHAKAQIRVMAIDCDNAATDDTLSIIEQALKSHQEGRG